MRLHRGSRLAAVLFADVVGYSDLSLRDEAKAFRLIDDFQKMCREVIPRYGGRVVKFLGDAVMAEFPSGRAAIAAAAALHEGFDLELHIGIHVGEVMSSGDDLIGDGVNVAARLQDLAEAGEILVSGAIAFQLRQRREIEFEPRGERELKGVGQIRVFAVSLPQAIEPEDVLQPPGPAREARPSWWIRSTTPRVLVPIALLAAVAIGWLALGGRGPGRATVASIAVLPFETVGEANPTLSAGIHGDLLTRLSTISGLDVISRASVMRYRDQQTPLSEVARELNASWILHGEVQQVGDRVQVNARLVEAREDRQVWAEGFRRDLSAQNLFDIQQEITLQIVAALEMRLTPSERRAIERQPTDDLEAYRLYVQGRELLDPRTEESMRRAVGYFEDAIERDPEYALAWAGLADALALLESYAYPTPAGSIDPEQAARRALQIEPDLAEAHSSLGILAHIRRDNATAIQRFQDAIELRPSYAEAHNLLSWTYQISGRPEAALESAQRAVELDPRNPEALSNFSFSLMQNGRMEEAVRELRRLKDLAPEFTTGPFYEALALYHLGRFAEAQSILEGLPVVWAGAGAPATLALSQVALADTAGARKTLTGIDPSEHPFSVALVRAALGETDLTVEDLDGIEQWEYWPTLAVRYFFPEVLEPLRDDPRYPDLIRRVDGSWGM